MTSFFRNRHLKYLKIARIWVVNITSSYEHQKKGNSVKAGTGKKGMSFEWLLPRVDM